MSKNLDKQVEQSILIATSKNTSTAGVLIKGSRGTGKSTVVRNILANYNKQYFYFSGKITPLGLFNILMKHHDEIVVLDDAEISNSSEVFSFLKAALGRDKDGKPCRVSYAIKDRQTDFIFSGTLIIITNGLDSKKDKAHLDAVTDRMFIISYELDYEEMLAKMEDIALNYNYRNMSTMQRHMIFEYIKLNTNKSQDLSLRTLIRAFDAFITFKDNWREVLDTSILNNIQNKAL